MKFELGEEKRLVIIVIFGMVWYIYVILFVVHRIVLVRRPLRLDMLIESAQHCFRGHKFTIYFSNSEVSHHIAIWMFRSTYISLFLFLSLSPSLSLSLSLPISPSLSLSL